MSDNSLSSNNWSIWIQCYCWFYELLSADQQREFLRLLTLFLDEANFVGVGIEITEEIKIAVGGWAVFLVLNRPLTISWYKRIERISIYPGDSLPTGDALGQLHDGHYYCQVHLAWEDVRDFSTKASVGSNTILHEFAHSLDHIDRNINGKPSLLLKSDQLKNWDAIFSPEYLFNRSASERDELWDFFGLGAWHEFTPDDPACVDVAELFAVATEFFFERPIELKKRAPEIYDCLLHLYGFDPARQFTKKKNLKMIWDALEMATKRRRWT